jgi:hypothetical protein
MPYYRVETKGPPHFYTATDGKLFVPDPVLLKVRNASSPAAVLRRAGLSPGLWHWWTKDRTQHKDHLADWLYGLQPAGNFAVTPTPAMQNFRRCASLSAIAAAVGRRTSCLRMWLRRYQELDWFPGWLLRGEDPPPDVVVATEKEAGRMRDWCDFAGHCEQIETKPMNSYVEWLRFGKIPTVRWLLWLYGWREPDGAFVVSEKLQRLRVEQTPTAICKAAGLDYSTYRKAKGKPQVRAVLAEAKGIAASPGHLSRDSVGTDLPAETLRWIWAYADKATLPACLGRAGLLAPSKRKSFKAMAPGYYKALHLAEGLRVDADLRDYIANGERWQNKVRLAGLVAPNLFVPSPTMLRFRAEAKKVMVRAEIADLMQTLPAFEKWFLDLATPRVDDGRRLVLTGEVPCENGHATGTKTVGPTDLKPSPSPKKGRGRRPGSFDKKVAERKTKMLEAWDRGDFHGNKSAAGRAHGFHRSDASKTIAKHEAQKCRK